MRVTQNLLKKYLENQSAMAKLASENERIREAVLKLGRKPHKIGQYDVLIKRWRRTIPETVERIKHVFGAEARKILKTISGDRVQIKKVD
jgi:hypothetical protein